MEPFFTKNFAGQPFVLFSPQHLAAIAAIVLVNLFIVYLANHRDSNFKAKAGNTLRLTIAWVLVLNEIAWHVWNAAVGQWNIQTMLPFHLCSVLVWLSSYMLFTRSFRFYEFTYLLGIAGALQAVLTPDLGAYSFPHFRYFQTFISHGLIITAAVYMTLLEKYRPTWASIGRVFLWGNVYMAIIGVVNWLIGSNYLFIAHKPPTASLLDMLGPWPWYILAMEALGLFLSVVLYLPFAFRDGLARRSLSRRPV